MTVASTRSITRIPASRRSPALTNSRRTGRANVPVVGRRQPTDGYDHMKSIQRLG